MSGPGVRQKGLDNMKQISTGAGLLGLGVCMVATAFIATHRGSGEAFAQGTGTERRIVAQGVYLDSNSQVGSSHWGYRVWSDNVTEVKFLGITRVNSSGSPPTVRVNTSNYVGTWQIVDSGTSAFFASDIDRSGSVDSGDISAVLLNFNETTDPTTPPPIDCTINAPR
jgi:hypothetical protein